MLKPSELGVTGSKRSIAQHKDLVIRNLKKMSNKLLVRVCMEVMEAKPGDIVNIDGLTNLEISSIKNFFAEVSGPIWIQEKKLIPGVKPHDKTFFSDLDNERLYDFIVYKGQETLLISNKQKKGGTNTLKAVDVLHLVDRDKALSAKWKNTMYYGVFDTLNSNNVISGPMKAISKYYPRAVNVTSSDYNKVLSQMTKNDVIIENTPKSIMNLINANPDTQKKLLETGRVSGTMVNFLFERLLIAESIKDANYNELFLDVTDGNVLFLKFDISKKGVVYYNIENPRDSKKKAILRSKQGVERRSSSGSLKLDKLGFQP